MQIYGSQASVQIIQQRLSVKGRFRNLVVVQPTRLMSQLFFSRGWNPKELDFLASEEMDLLRSTRPNRQREKECFLLSCFSYRLQAESVQIKGGLSTTNDLD